MKKKNPLFQSDLFHLSESNIKPKSTMNKSVTVPTKQVTKADTFRKKDKQNEELRRIEELECKYLDKYYHLMKFAEDEIIKGLKTKDRIKDDWHSKWNPDEDGKGISDFSIGAERIIYSIFNSSIGSPNSAPIGSDLFFEVEDAFIHIDLKTVQTRNIGDYVSDIFVGNNQTSYRGKLIVNGEEKIYDEASLPFYYTLNNSQNKIKPCLTYFITILYEEYDINILNINLLCMPNGILNKVYGSSILKAGKMQYVKSDKKRMTHQKTIRYRWSKNIDFKLLSDKKRARVIFLKDTAYKKYGSRLKVINDLYQGKN